MRPLVLLPLVALLLLISPPPDSVLPAFDRARASAAPLLVGIHAPNRDFDEQDYARVAEGEFGAVKMMGYHPLAAYQRLLRSLPDLRFYVRLFTPWNELPSPEQFVNANAPHLRELVAAGLTPWVEIGNEPNLELHPRAEEPFVEWYLAVLTGLRRAVPEARYGFPGLARDLRERDWLETNARAVEASDWLGVHAYWHDEREMLDPHGALELTTVHARFPDVPVVITEAGSLAGTISPEERGRQYARFVRTVAQLPYVDAVHFFILSGSDEWRRFFFDHSMVAAVRRAATDPLPEWASWLGVAPPSRRVYDPTLPAVATPASRPIPTVRAAPTATPTPEPFFRRRLLADPTPAAATLLAPAPGARWQRLSPRAAPAASLRTSSAYTVTDVAARFTIAPPRAGEQVAVQIAEADLFSFPSGPPAPDVPAAPASASSPAATGFVLLWDGATWRLQYRRAGRIVSDVRLAGAPSPDTLQEGEWLKGEIAIEPRSAAAWLWRTGEPQPAIPSAVFAPPENAALDGARPRALFLPSHPIADVVLEGATRYS